MRVVLSVSMSSLSFDSVVAASASAAFSREISCLRLDSVDVASASAACISLIWSSSSFDSSSLGPGIDGVGPVGVSLVMIDGSVANGQAIGFPDGHLERFTLVCPGQMPLGSSIRDNSRRVRAGMEGVADKVQLA